VSFGGCLDYPSEQRFDPSAEELVMLAYQSKDHSLAKQVHEHYLPKLLHHDPNEITTEQEITARNRLFNVDGFGLAWVWM